MVMGPGSWNIAGSGRGRLTSALDIDSEDSYKELYGRTEIKRLFGYLKHVKMLFGLGAGGMLLRTLATIAYPYIISVGIDNIMDGNYAGLNVTAIVYGVAVVLAWCGGYLETRCLHFAGQRILLLLRTQMFDHLQSLSQSFFDNNSVGKLMSRVQNDIQQLEQLLTMGFLHIVTNILTIIGITAMMFILNVQLSLIILSVVPVLTLILFIWQRYAQRAFIKVRRAIATVNTGLQQNISGVRVVQSLTREDVNVEEFDSVNKEHLQANISATKLTAVMMPLVEILSAAALALLVVFGGGWVLNDQLSVGVMVAFVLYIRRFFNPMRELAMEYALVQRAMASGTRIFELLDTKPEIVDSADAIPLPPVSGKIEFANVCFAYTEDKDVLRDINLAINSGQNVAIVGKTGSGKSTLVSLLCRFYDVTSGSIRIDGHDIRDVTSESLLSQIGIVQQEPMLFYGSIEDNIRFGNTEADGQTVIEAAKTAGAHDFIMELDRGYDSPVGERGGGLSVGQRQLICFARVLLKDPPILILDEATANVDTKTESVIQKSLVSILEGRTCIIIAHRLSTITFADHILVLDEGEIIERGTHQQLLEQKGHYYDMYRMLAEQ